MNTDDPPPASAPVPDPTAPGASTSGESRVFWTLYALAWIAYGGGYLYMFVSQGGDTLGEAAAGAFRMVAPAAVLGVGVVKLARRWTWPPERPVRFAVRHVLSAVVYSFLWVTVVLVVAALRRVAEGAPFELYGFANQFIRWQLLVGLLLYGTVAAGTYLADVGRRLRSERERAARADALRVRAEIEAIRSRLNPHFLFNALHSALSLIRKDPDRAERALERLGDLMRYAMGGDGRERPGQVTVGRELAMVRTYLELEKLRLGDRLEVTEEIDPRAREVPVPPLTVQPLVENAVRHGIAETAGGGTIRLAAAVQEGAAAGREERDGPGVTLTVADDGPGTTEGAMEAADGLGLQLVRQRLELLYGGEADLEVETAPGAGFTARIRVPMEIDAPRAAGEAEEGGTVVGGGEGNR